MVNPKLLTVLVTFVCVGQCLRVEANGLGENYLRIHDTDEGQELNDSLFEPTQKDRDLLDNNKLLDSIKAMKIDIVAPNKQLRDVMNTVSTKVRSMFFENYDHYFKELNIGSTSRPMLYTYLGLKFATQEQMNTWYGQQRKRIQSSVISGCDSLSRALANSLSKLHKEQQEFLDTIIKTPGINRLYVARSILNNNLNLFMLENYLLLCSRLEPDNMNNINLMI